MKKLFWNQLMIILFVIVSNSNLYAQPLVAEWVVSTGGIGNEYSFNSKLDGNGNLYVVSAFENTFDADPGLGIQTETSQGLKDICIQKFSPSGGLIWARAFGGTDQDIPLDISIDPAGNSYIVGRFALEVDFDSSPNTELLSSNGGYDGFVLKLDPNGGFVWVKQFAGTDYVDVTGIYFTPNASLVICGNFAGTIDLNPSITNDEYFTSNGGHDFFTCEFNSDGNYQWGHSIGGSSDENCTELTVDEAGNVYVVGGFIDAVNFSLASIDILISNNGSTDAFVQKLNSGGDHLWVRSLSGDYFEKYNAIALDENNDIVLGGIFQDAADFDPGSGILTMTTSSPIDGDPFIQKLDSAGSLIWAQSYQGLLGANDMIEDLHCDANNSIYAVGRFTNTLDADAGSGVLELVASGPSWASDALYLKLNPSGGTLFAHRTGSSSTDAATSIITNGNAIYISGFYSDTVDFTPNGSSQEFERISAGQLDNFILKLADFVGLEEMKEDLIKIYPNPTSESVFIEINDQQMYTLEVLDNLGRTIGVPIKLNKTNEINMERFEPGTYYIKLQNRQETVTKKLIKQ